MPRQGTSVCAYQLPWIYRLLLFVGLGFLAVMAGWTSVVELRAGARFPVFGTITLALFVFDAYFTLWRMADRVELTPGELVWRAPARSQHIPLEEVRSVGPARVPGLCRVRVAGPRGRGFLVLLRPGLDSFVSELVGAAPQVAVPAKGLGRMAMGMSIGGSSFRRG